ncbi:unnamed protein product [Pieris macdunnoughi]|uniref:Uncharacterized protein n=1 Tax=Pieris macdunnoughi TaxID=345717 RepID=A0A821YAU4_9NEOP|nr:unnamed protein product [Pieris macdunnoughi]
MVVSNSKSDARRALRPNTEAGHRRPPPLNLELPPLNHIERGGKGHQPKRSTLPLLALWVRQGHSNKPIHEGQNHRQRRPTTGKVKGQTKQTPDSATSQYPHLQTNELCVP